MKKSSPILWLCLVLTVILCLSTYLEPRIGKWTNSGQGQSLLAIAMGDGRKLFAKQFYTKADAYFHSGYYPSIFDEAASAAAAKDKDMAGAKDKDGNEEQPMGIAQPRDWIDRFGRNFIPNTHSHLDKPGEAREILPWLQLSVDLDPQMIKSYLTAAYWLRLTMHKPDEAEQFLREGLRANPNSYEILHALARIYDEDRHDPDHAINLWELALQKWQEQDEAKQEPDKEVYLEMVTRLAQVEEQQGRYDQAMRYLQLELKASPFPESVQKLIDDLTKKRAEAKAKP